MPHIPSTFLANFVIDNHFQRQPMNEKFLHMKVILLSRSWHHGHWPNHSLPLHRLCHLCHQIVRLPRLHLREFPIIWTACSICRRSSRSDAKQSKQNLLQFQLHLRHKIMNWGWASTRENCIAFNGFLYWYNYRVKLTITRLGFSKEKRIALSILLSIKSLIMRFHQRKIVCFWCIFFINTIIELITSITINPTWFQRWLGLKSEKKLRIFF